MSRQLAPLLLIVPSHTFVCAIDVSLLAKPTRIVRLLLLVDTVDASNVVHREMIVFVPMSVKKSYASPCALLLALQGFCVSKWLVGNRVARRLARKILVMS